MPNWCEQDLTVTVPDTEDWKDHIPHLVAFMNEAKSPMGHDGYQADQVLSADQYVPYPEGLDYQKGGYDWCITNWGSKWGIVEPTLTHIDLEYGRLEYTFRSAWSPVIPVILAMSQANPSLIFTLRYFEQGMGFHGLYRVKAGEVLEDKQGEYYGKGGMM